MDLMLLSLQVILIFTGAVANEDAVCTHLGCTENEVCERREFGVGCYCVKKPNPDNFDAVEACTGNNGSVSLSRCQLLEAGYSVEDLHLNDPNCTGIVQDGRLIFSFDHDTQLCGGNLESNATHLIYTNAIGTLSQLVIHRNKLNISVSCVYPLSLSLSMTYDFHVLGSVINMDIPSFGSMYQSYLLVYPNSSFIEPFSGDVTIAANQRIYVAVKVEGFTGDRVATVLDNCWASPNVESNICWNLIIKQCPNPDDGTVEVLQNGVSISSYFSFKMMSFFGFGHNIFLNCQVHLCLLDRGSCAQPCDGNSTSQELEIELP